MPELTTTMKVAGCSNPTIYRLLDILRRFNAEAELKIMQTSTGLELTRKPRNKAVKQNEMIKKNCAGLLLEQHCSILQIPRTPPRMKWYLIINIKRDFDITLFVITFILNLSSSLNL